LMQDGQPPVKATACLHSLAKSLAAQLVPQLFL